jgi:hypothetical protein
MTQCEKVLALLKAGPLCSYAFYTTPGLTHRLGARIYDLRQQGHIISTAPCENLAHNHESPAVVYQLASIDQMSLPL